MTQPAEADDDVIEAQYADPVDVFYLEWGRETLKQVIPRLTDSLQRVITLATALLGGSMFFASSDVVPSHFRAAAMILFLASLSMALYGILPYSAPVGLNDPRSVQDFKATVAEFRQRWLWHSVAALWLGLTAGVLGAVIKAMNIT